jgi:hypothetical protein
MNQPKFKFGDKVKTLEGAIFTVNEIRKNQTFGSYDYKDYGEKFSVCEENLELYQEPQKKTLLAYWDEDECGEYIKFRPPGVETKLSRAPGYDIKYLETHKDKVCEL